MGPDLPCLHPYYSTRVYQQLCQFHPLLFDRKQIQEGIFGNLQMGCWKETELTSTAFKKSKLSRTKTTDPDQTLETDTYVTMIINVGLLMQTVRKREVCILETCK